LGVLTKKKGKRNRRWGKKFFFVNPWGEKQKGEQGKECFQTFQGKKRGQTAGELRIRLYVDRDWPVHRSTAKRKRKGGIPRRNSIRENVKLGGEMYHWWVENGEKRGTKHRRFKGRIIIPK